MSVVGTDYVDLALLKAGLSINENLSVDDELRSKITTASRLVDRYCNRPGFGRDSVASAKRFRPFYDPTTGAWAVDLVPFVTGQPVTVQLDNAADGTYATTLVSDTDYLILPYENPDPTRQPSTGIEFLAWLNYSNLSFRVRPPFLKVTATWGWPSVPDEIAEATLLLARDLWMQRNAKYAFGVVGTDEFGPIRARMNQQVRDLLRPYVRLRFAA